MVPMFKHTLIPSNMLYVSINFSKLYHAMTVIFLRSLLPNAMILFCFVQ